MFLLVQNSLIQVRQAPALGHVKAEELRKHGSGLTSNGISPGAEGRQQMILAVKGKVSMHHGADADHADFGQRFAIAMLHVCLQRSITVLQACPYLFQIISPDTVNKLILPSVAANSKHLMICIH